uniref:G-protein coupled receptors family 1 profile domain-containing protein n=1 Tax=Acrobeloides nanus TaxID=290746 RepID=A0A914CU17_9BILA
MFSNNLTLPEVSEGLPISEDGEIICGEYETYTLARFLFIFVSSWIALFGTSGNLFLLYLFSARNYPNTPPTLYPGVLAILDAIICAMYIFLFGADAAIVFLHIKEKPNPQTNVFRSRPLYHHGSFLVLLCPVENANCFCYDYI